MGSSERVVQNGIKKLKRSVAKLTTPLSEGWLELFLTPAEKNHFTIWDEQVLNKSTTNYLITPLVQTLQTFLPLSLAPNLITLTGLTCVGQAYYIQSIYGSDYPTACTWFAVGNILVFFVTNSLDTRHAVSIRQKTALNELFKYCCDCVSTVFLALLTTYCLGVTEWTTQWYAVQTAQLILFTKHLSAFHRNAGVRYNVLSGPGEVIFSILVLLTIRATFGLDWMINLYGMTVHRLVLYAENRYPNVEINTLIPSKSGDIDIMGAELIRTLYYLMYATAVIKCLLLGKEHSWSRFGMSVSLLMRLTPALLVAAGIPYTQSTIDVLCDGLFMSILISDVTLAKMAGREIHSWVVLMSFASMFSHSVILALVVIYFTAVFGDLCYHMNLPLLTVCRNVYCDGVYDLCHIGHKNLFKRALTFGNRLFVGVCGDADCKAYKRPPIMSHDERCAEVGACKAVTKVIENAPCFGITQDFLDKHQIHVVAFGQEYLDRWPDPNDDVYYGYCRKIGIAMAMPRTPGLSTSDLIKRIQEAAPADEKKTPVIV